MNRIIVVIQARMGSTRLPGKVIKQIVGMPVLWHVIERVSKSEIVTDIVVATSINLENDVIREFCSNNNISCYSGSEQDVLERYIGAAEMMNADESDLLVRITSDCPLIDPEVIDKVIIEHKNKLFDYSSNVVVPTYPDGLDCEVFSYKLLKQINTKALKQEEREHVTIHFRNHPELFKLNNIYNNVDYSKYRWTLDQKEDLDVISYIYSKLYVKGSIFHMRDILNLIDENPSIFDINSAYKRNTK